MAKDEKAVNGKEVPKSNVPKKEAVEGEKKEKKLIPDIIRGRMPIAVVAMVRFGDQKMGATKDLAKMFGTTVGKIDDIKKKHTFAYLPDAFRPTKEQKEEGIEWLKQHVDFKKGGVDVLINELEKTKVATAEDVAAYEKLRVAARGQKPTTKTGEKADAGGGNRMKAPAAKAAAPAAKTDAKDLL
jgi:hypothetical protein